MKGNVYTDDKENRLEVFFDDYGMIEFAVNEYTFLYYHRIFWKISEKDRCGSF